MSPGFCQEGAAKPEMAGRTVWGEEVAMWWWKCFCSLQAAVVEALVPDLLSFLVQSGSVSPFLPWQFSQLQVRQRGS